MRKDRSAENWRESKCKSCEAPIVWKTFPTTGTMHPYNPDGTSHFSTCPNAKEWRGKKLKTKQLDLF